MTLYTPSLFAATDRAAISRLIHDHPFATLITPAQAEPLVTHLPLLLAADCEPHGTLLGHVARANPHWRAMQDAESVAVFHGPHAYVSPSWYADPARAVPTWNYAVVHAHGIAEIVTDPKTTRGILDHLTQRFEGNRDAPWQLALPERERDAMIGAIVAFRLRIRRIEGKFKLSQNRPQLDRARVIAALDREHHADAHATAEWMRCYAPPQSPDEPT